MNDDTILANNDSFGTLEDENMNTTENTNLTRLLEEEVTVNNILGLEQMNIQYIYDTLNSLPEDAFQSNNLTDPANGFNPLESDINESEITKQTFKEMLGLATDKHQTDNEFESLIMEESEGIDVNQSLKDGNIDDAINNLKRISNYSDVRIKGVENKKIVDDSIQYVIERLKDKSCTYTKCT